MDLIRFLLIVAFFLEGIVIFTWDIEEAYVTFHDTAPEDKFILAWRKYRPLTAVITCIVISIILCVLA